MITLFPLEQAVGVSPPVRPALIRDAPSFVDETWPPFEAVADELDQEFADALRIIEESSPALFAGVCEHVRNVYVVDCGDPPALRSCSSKEHRGIVTASFFAPGDGSLAECLIHEMLHQRFYLWSTEIGFVDPKIDLLHPHPWKPHPRRLVGVLLALHAFAGVTLLYSKALSLADRKSRLWKYCFDQYLPTFARCVLTFRYVDSLQFDLPWSTTYLSEVSRTLEQASSCTPAN